LYCIHFDVSSIRRISYALASSRRPFAPASIHLSASVLMTCRISWIDAGDSLKHRPLSSFHNCHETKANRESMPLRRSLVTMDRRRRHHLMAVVESAGNVKLMALSTRNQISLENGHTAMMWSMDSSTWSQRWHLGCAGSPCRRRRSVVQCLRRRASHRKILTLSGAQAFHTRLWPTNGVDPSCNIM
jgi:hypothetical protein